VTVKTEKPDGEAKAREITFKCKQCDQVKPLGDMMIIARFSPPVVLCRECEKKIR